MIQISNTSQNITVLFEQARWFQYIETVLNPRRRCYVLYEPLTNTIKLELTHAGGYKINDNRKDRSQGARPGFSLLSKNWPEWPSHPAYSWNAGNLQELLSTGCVNLELPAGLSPGKPRSKQHRQLQLKPIPSAPEPQPMPETILPRAEHVTFTLPKTQPPFTEGTNMVCRVGEAFFAFDIPEPKLTEVALLFAAQGWLKVSK